MSMMKHEICLDVSQDVNADLIIQKFKTIPQEKTLLYLHLYDHGELSLKLKALTRAFTTKNALPDTLTAINLSGVGIRRNFFLGSNNVFIQDFIDLFKSIPENITTLDLTRSFVLPGGDMAFSIWATDLLTLLKALPHSITSLNLSDNALNRAPYKLPLLLETTSHIVSLNLSNNNLFKKISIKTQHNYLNNLRSHTKNRQIILDDNMGDSYFLSAFLPLISSVKQGMLCPDVMFKILTYLLPDHVVKAAEEQNIWPQELITVYAFVMFGKNRETKPLTENKDYEKFSLKKIMEDPGYSRFNLFAKSQITDSTVPEETPANQEIILNNK